MVVDSSLSYDEVDRIFQALADRTRRDILNRAMGAGQSVSALARHYEMSFAAVQKHVAVLERADLVHKERRGREQIVQASEGTIARAIAPAFPFRFGDIVDYDDGRRVWRAKVSDVDYRRLLAEITRDGRTLRSRVPFSALEFVRRSTRRRSGNGWRMRSSSRAGR